MSLNAAIADLLAAAGNAGATLADVLKAVRRLVPRDRAEQTAARLARAGQACPDPARRVVQDRLNRLVTAGTLTARGEGDDRRFFPTTTETTPMLNRPKPKRVQVPLERLTFDQRLQQRAGLGEKGFDEATVQEYVTARTDLHAELPPLKAVLDPENAYWVFGGFHSGEALRRCGVPSADVLVWEGTFEDALLYSLGENAGHGKTRTIADKQKALSTLLDSPKLRNRVLESAGDDGGVIRGIASAVQVSKGMVTEALKARGLRATRTGNVVRADPKPAAPPAPKSPPAKPEPSAAPGEADSDAPEAEAGCPADAGDPLPTAPEFIRAAVASGRRMERLAAVLRQAAHELDREAQGPGGIFLRKAVGPDGEPLLRELKVRRGEVATAVYALPELLGLIRLLKRARPDKVCACVGAGCKACRGAGFLPANLNLLPVAGKTGDLFDTQELRDVWDE